MPRPRKQKDTAPDKTCACEAGIDDNCGRGGEGEPVSVPIDSSIQIETNTQECYVTLIGATKIADRLDTLYKISKERNDEELKEHIRILKFEFGRMCTRAAKQTKCNSKAEALAILANDWGWQHKNLGYDIVHLIRTRCDVPAKDLAALLGISEAAVSLGLARHETKIGEQVRLYEDSEKHERADLLMDRIYRYIMDPNFPAMDRDKLNAAKGYIELYNKQLERDTSLTWRQVSLVSDWFFSELLPTLQQQLQSAGAGINIRQICLDLFEKLTGDIREITTKVKLPPTGIEEIKEGDKPNLTKSGRPKRKPGRKPKGGEKHF